ncbi:MAG: HupE/UreJ family protein [Novosphingobium sp.]
MTWRSKTLPGAGRILAFLLAILLPALAQAHETRPAYLELVEQQAGLWSITWKQPVMGDVAVRLEPSLSNGWLARRPSEEVLTPSMFLRRWQVQAPASELTGATLRIGGLEHSITNVLVHVRNAQGKGGDMVLRPGNPEVVLNFSGWQAIAAKAYFRLGIEHILGGADHLLFVAGLVLLVGLRWRLVGVITSFTLAHSLTLAASTLGWVHAPVAVIEALVALSILFVARELLRGGDSLTRRQPWLVAFAFGLLHGFAFAGSLADTGLPQDSIPLALLLFNLGVEAGQLLFVGLILVGIVAWIRFARPIMPTRTLSLATRVAPYAIGCYAGLIFVERTTRVFA